MEEGTRSRCFQLDLNFIEIVCTLNRVGLTISQIFIALGPVVRSLVSANRWLRGIKTYRFPWYLTLVRANHASSNPGLDFTSVLTLNLNINFPQKKKQVLNNFVRNLDTR